MDLQNKKTSECLNFQMVYTTNHMLHILCYISYLKLKKTIFCGHLSHDNEYQLFYPKNEACTVHGLSQNLPKTEN